MQTIRLHLQRKFKKDCNYPSLRKPKDIVYSGSRLVSLLSLNCRVLSCYNCKTFLPFALFSLVLSLISSIGKFQELSQIYFAFLVCLFVTGLIAFPSLYIFYEQASHGVHFNLRVFRIWRLGRLKVQFLTSKIFFYVTPCRLWNSYRRFEERHCSRLTVLAVQERGLFFSAWLSSVISNCR